MSGQSVPADFSGNMLDLDEDDDLEVFSKVRKELPKTRLQLRTLSFEPSHCFSRYVDLTLALTYPL